eukprot:CAMPEP_0203962348 /NCGR_PEP_ID=MMETSP0359-20131031/92564_1 /ASSEMBLY_ACC=CAM_ASM_000338 /TAXON_ID=268821 /ORGANISM="Scrippsiella Hangoei, Strain SHTV-5" /LENGTH=136 /DNA_ID=CAMNT_0050897625 /DNA_START=71 /DNA_END=481 /DNA_ORIENTATION=+
MARGSSSGMRLVLLAAALLLIRWSSEGFVGTSGLRGAPACAPSGLRGAPARAPAVARFAATADTMSKVVGIIAEQLGVDKEKVTREKTLSELGADSLDIVESIMALEEGFDVELPDEETTTLKNVGDVMDLIQSKL